MSHKKCKDCGEIKPETREFFGQYKNKRGGVTKIGYRNSCRSCMAKRTAKHSEENPELHKARVEKYFKTKAAAGGGYTQQHIRAIRKSLDDKCRFCGKVLEGRGEIEHLTPISRGGSNSPSNLTLSCPECNKEKTKKTLHEYVEWRLERKLPVRQVKIKGEKPDLAKGSKVRGRNA
jgi:5-methylcytosine-specific restriction endonuclease McrA